MGHPALVRPTEGLDGDPFIPPKVFTQWWADGEAMTGDVRLTKAWCPIQAVVWLEWDNGCQSVTLSLINRLPPNHGAHDLDVLDLVLVDRVEVIGQHHVVRELVRGD